MRTPPAMTRAQDRPRPQRVALVYDAVYPYQKGGGERRFRALAEQLARSGYQVDLYGMRSWPGRAPLPVAPGVRLHGLCRARPLYTASGRRSIVQSLLFGLACLKLLWRRFDVVDCCGFPFFSLFACRLVASARRRPLLSTWNEVWGAGYWRDYLGPVGGRVGAVVERAAARLPDRIVCVSDLTARRLRSELGCRKPLHIVPNGVDLAAARAVRPDGLVTDVLFAGRLIAEKRVDLLLRALALLPADQAPATCRIVGDGPERRRLERLSADLGLSGRVRFAGSLPADLGVLAAMKSAKVLVLPSFREGFGMVALEANACGVPVITVDHPGNAAVELIRTGRNGWVVPPTAAALADAIRHALTRRTPVDSLVDRFDWGRLAESHAIADLYRPRHRPRLRSRSRPPATAATAAPPRPPDQGVRRAG